MGKLIERILLKEYALYKNPRRCAQFALLFPLLFPTFLEESEENESFWKKSPGGGQIFRSGML